MNSTIPSPADIAIYCATAQDESMTCIGWCPNPGIGGIGARAGAFAQAIISGYSIAWLPDPSDSRKVYYVQCVSSLSLVIIGYLYGGFLSDKSVTAYHALLIVYLTMGNVVSAAVAFNMGIFFDNMIALTAFIVSVLVFAVALTFMMMASTIKKGFGSQPECNSQLIQSPFHIPLGAVLCLLAIVPWIVSIVSIRIASCCSRKPEQDPVRRHYVHDLRRRLLWSLFLGGYYAAWIYLTDAYIKVQKVPMLTNAEYRFTQDQVQALTLATISSYFPLRAIASGFVTTTTSAHRGSREGSVASDQVPLVSTPDEAPDPPPYSDRRFRYST